MGNVEKKRKKEPQKSAKIKVFSSFPHNPPPLLQLLLPFKRNNLSKAPSGKPIKTLTKGTNHEILSSEIRPYEEAYSRHGYCFK
jgi:hypothetical protein